MSPPDPSPPHSSKPLPRASNVVRVLALGAQDRDPPVARGVLVVVGGEDDRIHGDQASETPAGLQPVAPQDLAGTRVELAHLAVVLAPVDGDHAVGGHQEPGGAARDIVGDALVPVLPGDLVELAPVVHPVGDGLHVPGDGQDVAADGAVDDERVVPVTGLVELLAPPLLPGLQIDHPHPVALVAPLVVRPLVMEDHDLAVGRRVGRRLADGGGQVDVPDLGAVREPVGRDLPVQGLDGGVTDDPQVVDLVDLLGQVGPVVGDPRRRLAGLPGGGDLFRRRNVTQLRAARRRGTGRGRRPGGAGRLLRRGLRGLVPPLVGEHVPPSRHDHEHQRDDGGDDRPPAEPATRRRCRHGRRPEPLGPAALRGVRIAGNGLLRRARGVPGLLRVGHGLPPGAPLGPKTSPRAQVTGGGRAAHRSSSRRNVSGPPGECRNVSGLPDECRNTPGPRGE